MLQLNGALERTGQEPVASSTRCWAPAEHHPNTGQLDSTSNDLVPTHVRVLTIGAQAVGALAVGVLAFGALAIGTLAIGRLVIGRSRIQRLEIDELVVGSLRVSDLRVTDTLQTPSTPGTEK